MLALSKIMCEILPLLLFAFWINFIVSFDLHTLGIWSTSQPNGLAVPDASLHPVNSTNDVLELMNVGLMNRAVGATALNERSSRSHRLMMLLFFNLLHLSMFVLAKVLYIFFS